MFLEVIPKLYYFQNTVSGCKTNIVLLSKSRGKPPVRFQWSGISSLCSAARLTFRWATADWTTSMGISRRITIPSMSVWGSMSSAEIRRPGLLRIGSLARVRLVFQRWPCAWRPPRISIGRIRTCCCIRPSPTNAVPLRVVRGISPRACMAFIYKKCG